MTDRPSLPDGPPVLRTGTTETQYHRAGQGPAVLLLLPEGIADELGAELFARLAVRFRVVAPVRPAGVEVTSWLRELIEGLGLIRPGIVADELFGLASLSLSMQEPDRVGAIVVIAQSTHGADDAGFLCVRVDPTGDATARAAAAEAQIVRFLSPGQH